MLKRKTRLYSTAFLTLSLALSLTACGGGSEPSSTEAPKDSGNSGNQASSSSSSEKSGEPRLSFRIAFPSGKGSMLYEAADLYKKKVEEKSNGAIEVKIFPDGQLGKDLAVLDALKLGSIEMSVPSSVMATKSPEFGVFDIPFLFEDRTKVAQIAHGEIWEKDLKGLLPQHGLVGLGFWENGFRQITNNKHPINTPADLAGLKIRVPDSKVRVAMFKEIGANPTPMDFSEVFTALQQGVVDGQENPLPTIKGGKLEEVQKYMSITNHTYTPAFLVASKVWFDKLSPEDQKFLTDVANEVGDDIRKLGEEEDTKLLDYFKEKGLEINTANIKSFKEETKPVVKLLEDKIDPAFIEKVVKAAE
ncbi:TRAP transporter substrate-binding protein [Ammoniphilus resinae]|uniref:Tripartite ATP-independent transporter DctP family solute receptor n=1 Tax=Ammoniphilus resinae TaxID=861532 RepID=A0ABS4GUE3_9BACL|nr:TRAP transporter substrate-binding protein [Ammoniphilus resinae]MBP1933864.1 tripartite ATP-independent transporter DctP family solute receptor [Ammoniphilus resinae]